VPCYAYGDADLLTRALGNIIKNAHEANREGGMVRITASCQEGTWRVEVEDEGEGIVPENLERLFEPFFTTRARGTGLGLAFALQVIRSHGGSITAENRQHRGALFRVEIPVEERGAGSGE
jgi:signal transduction histidine kinase